MKLELKHLAPYLPYGLELRCLNGINSQGEENYSIISFNSKSFSYYSIDNVKPYLRQLNELKNEVGDFYTQTMFDMNGYIGDTIDYKNRYIDSSRTFKIGGDYYVVRELPYDFFDKLCSKRYDVFGLIEAGLAIDINTLSDGRK